MPRINQGIIQDRIYFILEGTTLYNIYRTDTRSQKNTLTKKNIDVSMQQTNIELDNNMTNKIVTIVGNSSRQHSSIVQSTKQIGQLYFAR